MRKYLRRILAAVLPAVLFAASIPGPAGAQVVRPGPVGPARVCTLRLTGQQAWFEGTTHTCGGIQILTGTHIERFGYHNEIVVTYYDLGARRLPGLYSFARVEVVVAGRAPIVISPPTSGAWVSQIVTAGINAAPPTSVTLSSGFLF
jgi:hypothetical protein